MRNLVFLEQWVEKSVRQTLVAQSDYLKTVAFEQRFLKGSRGPVARVRGYRLDQALSKGSESPRLAVHTGEGARPPILGAFIRRITHPLQRHRRTKLRMP